MFLNIDKIKNFGYVFSFPLVIYMLKLGWVEGGGL